MAKRTFGWMQDCGDVRALKRIVQAFIKDSEVNQNLRHNKIPRYIPERCRRDEMIAALEQDPVVIPYGLLKGSGAGRAYQLSVEENMAMFGLCEDSARRMTAEVAGRGNAACSGIAQACLEAQKFFKTYVPDCLLEEALIKKPYQSDWAAEAFVKWAISLGLLDYDSETDVCTISSLGKSYAASEDESAEEKKLLADAYLSYPPVIRILSLLSEHETMTKYEIGGQFGFIGEAGFTSIPQDYFIFYDNEFPEMNAKANLEGTSDKYVRMICEWLDKLGWVESESRSYTCSYGGKTYQDTLKAYRITERGKVYLKLSRGYSRHPRIHKRVFCEMLATKITNGNYTQTKRAVLLKYLCTAAHTMNETVAYLKSKGFDELPSTIEDDIRGFESIGLEVSRAGGRYKVLDPVDCLEIPVSFSQKADIIKLKDTVGAHLKQIDHKYLALIDLAYSDADSKTAKNSDARDFEIQTANLLTGELSFIGERLGDSGKPDVIVSYGNRGIIIDNKSYKDGFNVDGHCSDEMNRYLEQNEKRHPGVPSNEWWKSFDPAVTDFYFLFVTSFLKGNFKSNMEYLSKMRGIKGAAIAVDQLLYTAEKLKSGEMTYEEFFDKFSNDVIISS